MTDRRDQHSVTGVLPAIEPVDCMVPFWRALPESSCADRPVTTLNLASGDTSIIMVKGLVVTAPCDWPGEDGLVVRPEPILASEDFAFFLEKATCCCSTSASAWCTTPQMASTSGRRALAPPGR